MFFKTIYLSSFYNPGAKPQSFMQALHEAISMLSLELFNLSFKWSGTEVTAI